MRSLAYPRQPIASRTFTRLLLLSLVVPFLAPHSAAQEKPQEDAKSIIHHSVEADNKDWAAAPEYDYTECDQDKGGGDGTRTYAVTMLLGSPYQRLIAINGKPLSPSEQAQEDAKYQHEMAARQSEPRNRRAARIAKYEAERKRDHVLMQQLTIAFDFKLEGEQELDGHKVYALKATPRKNYRPPNRDSQVLTGMEGKLWVDRDTYQWVRVEARVTRPVRIDGFLAEVQPGTHFELEKMPVSNEVWLPKHFAMKSDAKVMFFFSHHEQEDDTYSDYHKATNSQSRQAPDAAQNVGPSQ